MGKGVKDTMRWCVLLLLCSSVVATWEASADTLPSSSFSSGLQLSHVTYREPELMRESGIMYGVVASYQGLGRSLMGKIDATLSFGEVDYVGSYQDGTPLTIADIKDTMFEIRAVTGPTAFVDSTSSYIPYIGLGYRYLYDGADVAPGGYQRESNYLYVPLGVEGVPLSRGAWRFGFTVEYDLFLRGKQCSYLSDVDPGYNDVENEQSSGYGYRASLRFVRSGARDLIIEPFYKYWKIDESDTKLLTFYGVPDALVFEPENTSEELGIRFIMRF
jgi:hypothetical protein